MLRIDPVTVLTETDWELRVAREAAAAVIRSDAEEQAAELSKTNK